jgi:hypothetical protein
VSKGEKRRRYRTVGPGTDERCTSCKQIDSDKPTTYDNEGIWKRGREDDEVFMSKVMVRQTQQL